MWILTQQSDAKTLRGQTSCLLPGNQVEFPGRGTASSCKLFHLRRGRARVHASLRKKVARKSGTTQKKNNTTPRHVSRDGRSRSRLRLSAAHQRDWEMQTPAAAAVAKQIVQLLHERKKNPTTTTRRETTVIRKFPLFSRKRQRREERRRRKRKSPQQTKQRPAPQQSSAHMCSDG